MPSKFPARMTGSWILRMASATAKIPAKPRCKITSHDLRETRGAEASGLATSDERSPASPPRSAQRSPQEVRGRQAVPEKRHEPLSRVEPRGHPVVVHVDGHCGPERQIVM